MNKQKAHEKIEAATRMCANSGGRLTEKRKRILEILLLSEKPLSAYEVVEIYNKAYQAEMPSMSAYRILDFLENEHLAHKLSSANKYVACAHISFCKPHAAAQFLICKQCKSVQEISIPKKVITELDKQVVNVGYRMTNSQLELQCICERCAKIQIMDDKTKNTKILISKSEAGASVI